MTQLTDTEMAFRDALWEEIGSHADMTIGELNLAVHRTITALEAKGLCIVDRSRLEEISASGDWQPEGVMVPCAAWQELSAMLAARGE